MLVTNQPPELDQSSLDYLDWMVSVYKNHRHIERRMRNLKSDLPIRPLYVHRDEVIIPLCFVCVLALMLYTLIERDCQANPALVEAGLTTTDQLFAALAGHCLTVFYPPSGYQVFWFDTPTDAQTLIWAQFGLPNPGDSAPVVPPTRLRGEITGVFLLILLQQGHAESKMALPPTILSPFQTETVPLSYPICLSLQLLKCLSLCYAESKLHIDRILSQNRLEALRGITTFAGVQGWVVVSPSLSQNRLEALRGITTCWPGKRQICLYHASE